MASAARVGVGRRPLDDAAGQSYPDQLASLMVQPIPQGRVYPFGDPALI
jgi:hypothetical protein